MLTPNVLLTNPGPISLETDGLFLGFYYGLMLITIAYSCFLKQAFGDNIYSFYGLYLLTHISFFSFANGVLEEYFSFHNPWWNSFIFSFTLGLNLLAFLLFNANIFSSKDLSERWHFTIRMLMAIASFIALLSPFTPFSNPKTLLLLITILTYGTLFAVTLLVWKQGSFLKPYFFLAQLLLIIAALISNLVALEFLPLKFPSKYLTLLYLAAVLFFSLANAYRLNAIMKEKAEAQSKFLCKQAEAIFQTQELNLTMQKTYEQLEKKVQKRTAQLNKAKLDAEIANQTKSRFIANISHELRTPLNGILGYAQILQREAEIDPAQKEAIDTIYKCGFHLLALINDILDISQIQGNQMTLYPKDFNLEECLAEVVNTVRPRATQKKIAFHYQGSPELSKAIYADEKRLRQALLELLDNAIKFTEQGHVTFTVEVLETAAKTKSSQLAADKIRFQIEDTGIGMTPEQLTRLFMPFEQLDNLPHKAEGTGLGLVISQKLIQIMGGDIQVKSSPEKGTVFSFELELQLSSAISIEPKAQKIVNSANIVGFKGERNKITAVDDNKEALSFLVAILQSWGFIVSQANNGKEALEIIKTFKPDLIIADIFMSVMDGLEMMKILRKAKEFDDVVIVTSSARGYNYEEQLSLEAGADDFIAKPIKIQELQEKLQANLGLEWVYKSGENSAETREYLPADSSEIVPPPAAELEAIINAARIGDIHHIEQEANRIRQLHVTYIPFAEKIAELAGEFNDLEILRLVEELTINN